MPRVFRIKEIKVVTENKQGMLSLVTAPIASTGVNIGAFFSCARNGKAEFYFITADNKKVRQAFAKAGFRSSEREVIVVEASNEAGTLHRVAEQMSQTGVDLEYAYSTAGNLGTTWIVFATKRIEQAMNVIS